MVVARLGASGLKVSHIALGCMSFGDATRGGVNAWTLDDAAAEPIFRQAVELGITFWDTANVGGVVAEEPTHGELDRGLPTGDGRVDQLSLVRAVHPAC